MNEAADLAPKFFDRETLGVAMTGAVGQLATNFDFWMNRAIAVLTLGILLYKAWRILKRRNPDA